MKRKQKSPLVEGRPGDIVAVDIGNSEFCYLRLYQFGLGVLPFRSRGLVREIPSFPSLAPRFFTQTWVNDSDTTPTLQVGHVPFSTEAESYGQPMYYPPDPIESCYKIHGVFDGLFSIIKPVTENDVAGMERFQRYQPSELRSLLFSRHKDWVYIQP